MNSNQFIERLQSAQLPFAIENTKKSVTDLVDFPLKELWKNPPVLSDIQAFYTGSTLTIYPTPQQPTSDPVSPAASDLGYLVLRGRVRLLCESKRRKRPCSADLLHPGDIFGADHIFCSSPLSYTALAASSCQIASVTLAQLTELSHQYPAIKAYWQQQMHQRAQQVFFKRFTLLQTLPTKVLRRLLLPRLKERHLAAGAILGETLRPYQGYFWLRSGALNWPDAPGHTLPIGYGWSDRNQQILDGVAQTPVVIYQMSFQPWEVRDLAPVLDKLSLVA